VVVCPKSLNSIYGTHNPLRVKKMKTQWMRNTPIALAMLVPKAALQMGSTPRCLCPCQPKKLPIDGEHSPCGTSSNPISTSCKFFSLFASPWFENSSLN
jgi:hypothetical protein